MNLDLLKQGFPIDMEMGSHFAIQSEAAFVSQTVYCIPSYVCVSCCGWIKIAVKIMTTLYVHTVLMSVQLSMWDTFTYYMPSISTS